MQVVAAYNVGGRPSVIRRLRNHAGYVTTALSKLGGIPSVIVTQGTRNRVDGSWIARLTGRASLHTVEMYRGEHGTVGANAVDDISL